MARRWEARRYCLNLIMTFCFVGCVKGQSSGDVRLVDSGSSKFPAAGRLEIYLNFQWGTVCNDGYSFDQTAATVACKQLGFSTALSYGRVGSLGFYEGSGNVAIGNVNCYSTDIKLTSCTYTSSPSCSHYNDLAVRCRHTGDRVRLVSWNGRSDNISAGRLEVLQNYQWGTICNWYFNNFAADVACRQLGFSGYHNYGTTTHFNLPSASSTVQFWLQGLSCTSSESDLFSCSRISDSSYSCQHDDNDVALSCIGTGALRLVDSHYSSLSDELPSGGRLEIYLNGQWGTVSSGSVGFTDANVACRQLGFSSATDYGSVYDLGYNVPSSSTPKWLSGLSCDSYSETLLDCRSSVAESSSSYIYHGDDLAVKCDSPATTTPWIYSTGPSLTVILLISLGSLCLCSGILIVTSLVCVCVVCVRVKKRRARACFQRNVVEECSPCDPAGYPSRFSPQPPPPPYSAHEWERHATPTPGQEGLGSSMQPVVNFPENYSIEHEAFYPATVQPPGTNLDHATFPSSAVEDSGHSFGNNYEAEGEDGLSAEGSNSSVSENQRLISDSY